MLAGLGTGDERTLLPGRLRDAAMDQDGKCANGFFEMYGEEIADIRTLTEDNRIVSRLFSPLVRERTIGGLRWLREVLSKNTNLMNKYSDGASVQELRERLQGELGRPADEDDQAHSLIAEIANILGIEPEEETPEDEAANGSDRREDEGGEEENSKGE